LAFRNHQQERPLHAYICTPAYNGEVESDFAQSMTETGYCAPLHRVQITACTMGNGAFIELARNIFVKKFLEEHTDCTHLFFIDGDLKFEARAFIGLMKSGHPVCAGVYRRRQEPEDYPYKAAPDPENGGLWFVEDWLQCDRVPTGFLCIERSVLEEMAKDAPKIHVHNQGLVPWVFHPSFGGKWVPEDGASFIGEDYGFCDDYVKKYGKKIQVWTNFDFTHSGHKGNLFKWLTKANEKSEPTQTTSEAA
jgi:hypothetical protein